MKNIVQNMYPLNTKEGFSLVEIVVYTAVMSIFIVLFINIYFTFIDSDQNAYAVDDVQYNKEFIETALEDYFSGSINQININDGCRQLEVSKRNPNDPIGLKLNGERLMIGGDYISTANVRVISPTDNHLFYPLSRIGWTCSPNANLMTSSLMRVQFELRHKTHIHEACTFNKIYSIKIENN